jgi:hypothetical protein
MLRKTFTTFSFALLLLFGLQSFGQQALLVSDYDPGSLNAGDQGVFNRLQSLGLTVTVKGGPNNPVSTADATGKDLVFISSTVNSGNIGNMFQHVAVPVIVSESYLFDDMKMTGSWVNFHYGVENSVSQVVITDPNHPIAAGLSGIQTVTTGNTTLRWGRPANTADKIARLTSNGNHYAVFSYESGDHMVGFQAPAARVGFFFDDLTGSHTAPAGWTLFDQIVNFLLGSACTAQTEVLKVDNSTVTLSAGGTANVSAYQFTPGVVPPGYSVLYLLTQGGNQTVIQTATTPAFTVTTTGHYSIHSLVYDPNTGSADYFDVSTITTGTTNLLHIFNQINNSGICAAVDLAGDNVNVVACTADAGTLTIDEDPVFAVGTVPKLFRPRLMAISIVPAGLQ